MSHPSGTGTRPAPYPAYQPPAATSPGPPPGGPPVQTSWAPPPPRRRAPGPGGTTTAVVLALALLGGAGVLLAHRTGALDGWVALTVAGVALVVLGIGILVTGARGRRPGALAGIAAVVALLAVPAAVVTSLVPEWPRVVVTDGTAIASDVDWVPTTRAEAADGFSYAVGSVRVDLTEVPLSGTGSVDVPVAAGAGSTTIVLPADVPAEVRVRLGAGEIRTRLGEGWSTDDGAAARRTAAQGTNLDLVLRSPTEGTPALVVTVEAGFGEISIEEEIR